MPRDSRRDDDERPGAANDAVTSSKLQYDVAAMLRQAAHTEESDARMPDHLEARIRESLRAEGLGLRAGRPANRPDESARVVVPLPTQRAKPRTAQPAATSPQSQSSASVAGASSRPQTPESTPSLAQHRARKQRLPRAVLVLGAAAAIAVGSFGVWKGTQGSNTAPTAAQPSASAADVRVTNSHTAYWPGTFTTQAAALMTSTQPPITSSNAAKAQHLGDLATRGGVERCVKAIGANLASHPEKIYVDFGSYRGAPAVIMVAVNGGKKTAWAVNRNCTEQSDIQTGPVTIRT